MSVCGDSMFVCFYSLAKKLCVAAQQSQERTMGSNETGSRTYTHPHWIGVCIPVTIASLFARLARTQRR